MKYSVLVSLSVAVILSGCSSGIPDCSSDDAKKTLTNLIREEVKSKTEKYTLTEKFLVINTQETKGDIKSCQASIEFGYPKEYDESFTKEITLNYLIGKNEAQGGNFYIKVNSFDPSTLIDMQKTIPNLIREAVNKKINPKLDSMWVPFDPIKNSLLQNGFKETTKSCEEDQCEYKFSDDKFQIEVWTKNNKGNLGTSQGMLPVGELITLWRFKEVQ